MAIKITAPDVFTGIRSGLNFVDGVAEIHSLNDDAREVFTAHGFRIEGENGPTEAERIAAEEAEAARVAAEAEATKVQAAADEAERIAEEKAEAAKTAKAARK